MISNMQMMEYHSAPLRMENGVTMIRIVLCDDDNLLIERLRSEIRVSLKNLKIDATIRTYCCAEDIPEEIIKTSDLFFLDIDFPEKSYTGIDIAKKIRRISNNSIIIFLTNYIEYAPEGYEVQAFRYVLKSEIHRKLTQYLHDAIDKLLVEKETFQITISGEPITLYLKDILYIESQAHTAVIYTQGLNNSIDSILEYRVYSSLVSLEQQLSDCGFLRIQKSYLVNMRRIKRYKCNEAALDNGIILPVSEKTYAEQKKKYLLWKGQNR